MHIPTADCERRRRRAGPSLGAVLLLSAACVSWEQSESFFSRPDVEQASRDLLREELYLEPDAPDWRDRDELHRRDHAWAQLLASLPDAADRRALAAPDPARALAVAAPPRAEPDRFAGLLDRLGLVQPDASRPAAPGR